MIPLTLISLFAYFRLYWCNDTYPDRIFQTGQLKCIQNAKKILNHAIPLYYKMTKDNSERAILNQGNSGSPNGKHHNTPGM